MNNTLYILREMGKQIVNMDTPCMFISANQLAGAGTAIPTELSCSSAQFGFDKSKIRLSYAHLIGEGPSLGMTF